MKQKPTEKKLSLKKLQLSKINNTKAIMGGLATNPTSISISSTFLVEEEKAKTK